MAIFIKVTWKFNPIPKKPSFFFFFFSEIDKLILKSIWKNNGPQIAKTNLEKWNKIGVLTFVCFKTYCRATVIKTV